MSINNQSSNPLSASERPIFQRSLFFQCGDHSLHVRHIRSDQPGTPVLMLHGTIENGRIFYTESGKGLAGYLAKQGFDVYVADYRGRGLSTPSVKDRNDHGYYDVITEDMPFLVNEIFAKTGQPMHVICHSWGGVMFGSTFVRYPEIQSKVRSMVKFGTKRQVTVKNMERLLKVDLFWNRLAPVITKMSGVLNAKKLKIGADYEPRNALMQSIKWVKKSDWIDPVDGFDYRSQASQTVWPATWHMTGVNDYALGHKQDVKLFMKECQNPNATFSLLSKSNGNAKDYDHIDILTSPEAVIDHFPQVRDYLLSH